MQAPPASDLPAPPRGSGGDRTTIASPTLHRLQRRHFLLFDVVPAIGTTAAIGLACARPVPVGDIAVAGVLWLLTGLGLTVGYHRLFAHRAFATTPTVATLLVILGSMAARGPMISWVVIHRRHHRHSDRAGDLHSPNLHGAGLAGRLHGWLHAHLTWMLRHDYPNPRHYAPELLANAALLRANRRYYLWVTLGLAIPAAIGAAIGSDPLLGAVEGLLWGGAVRIFAVEHSMSAINSLAHLFGARPHDGGYDNSGNSFWLGLLAWGEGWHNNHHAYPYSAAFGLRWYQPDLGYWAIRLLRALGLAWDIRLPKPRPVATTVAAAAD